MLVCDKSATMMFSLDQGWMHSVGGGGSCPTDIFIFYILSNR